MILVSSDWHLDDNPINAYRHEFQKPLRSLIRKHGVKLLLMLGDICDAKDHHSAWLVNRVVSHLEKLRQLCNVIILRGNHDYVDANSPFYEFLQHIDGITWINEPTDANDGHLDLELTTLGKVLFLPHTANHKRDWDGIKLKTYDWIFAHATFQSAHVGHGMIMPGIPTNLFGDSTSVISGDVHVPQQLGPVTYVGAPYLVDFGDEYDPRVILFDGPKGKSIPVGGSQKRLIEMEPEVLADLERGQIAPNNVNPGDILKVRVLITGEQRAEWSEIKARVRKWGETHGYLIHVVQPVLLDALKGHSGKRLKHKQQTDEQLLQTYAKHNAIDKQTLTAGLYLLRRA